MPVAFGWTAVILLALWLLTTQPRFPRLNAGLLIVFFGVIGGLHATISLTQPNSPAHIAQLAADRRELSLIGVLVRSPEIGPDRTSLLMKAQEMLDSQGRRYATEGLVQLALAEPPPEELLPGDRFIARASVGLVPSFGVPGAFDYQEYMAYQGIYASGWIRSPALILKINRLATPSWQESIRYWPERVRYRLSRFLSANLPHQQAAVYQAILLGQVANLSSEVIEDFKASGSFHILSISGLHMGLVSICFTLLFSWLLRRSEWVLLHLPATKVAALLSLIPLTLYAVIAGFNPPVVRSLIMVSVFIGALLADRQWSIGNNIAIAALILLSGNPALIFTASFQLTFLAVIAIALFSPAVEGFIEQTPEETLPFVRRVWLRSYNWALASLLVSVVATLGTAPVLAYQFNRVSLISPLSTLLIEPFLCLWSLILGLCASLLVGLPALAKPLFAIGGIGIDISLALADYCARLPYSSIRIATPALTAVGAWYGALLVLARWRTLSRRELSLAVAACAILGSVFLLPVKKIDAGATVTILDVGQGSAIVIATPDEAVLIDGGRKQPPSSSSLDVGENLIAPYLWHAGIRRLSAVVCTHPDDDHYNGIPFILQYFKPKTLWVNGHESEEKGYGDMLEVARQLQIATSVPQEGMVIWQSGEARLTALTGGQTAPEVESGGKKTKKRGNDQSLVLRLTYDQTAFLLPSDIEKETEAALLSRQRDALRADVLLAPHHGSATSSSENLLTSVSPAYVAISAGQNQTGHFPAPETMTRYQKLGLATVNTAELGTLFFQTDGKAIEFRPYRDKKSIRRPRSQAADSSGT